jgi:lysophospholipase L1-like esterase
VLYVGFPIARAVWLHDDLRARVQPFQQLPENPQHRLLVIGDSTAVGVGASSATRTVAGFLGAQYPHLTIVNRAESGATLTDVRGQLRTYRSKEPDTILVLAGGNDVLNFHGSERLNTDADALFAAATERAEHVVWLPAGNLGAAPMFKPPLSWLMSARSHSAREVFQEVAAQYSIGYVDVYHPRARDPFLKAPERFYATDGIHLSGSGYRSWYQQVQAELREQVPYFAAASGPLVRLFLFK